MWHPLTARKAGKCSLAYLGGKEMSFSEHKAVRLHEHALLVVVYWCSRLTQKASLCNHRSGYFAPSLIFP